MQLVRCALSQQGSLVLAAAASQSSPVSPQFTAHVPWPQALGLGPREGSQSPTGPQMPCWSQFHTHSIFLFQYTFFQKAWANFVSHGICKGREDAFVRFLLL